MILLHLPVRLGTAQTIRKLAKADHQETDDEGASRVVRRRGPGSVETADGRDTLMIQDVALSIRLTPGALKPRPDQACVGELRGGPETLLQWLETQLGLPIPTSHTASRITEYASALDTVDGSVIDGSMKTDRWATASELLLRRDELLLAGWDETDSEALPDVVRDLARAATGQSFAFPDEATRLRRVLAAFNAGQVLPPHRCVLQDSPDQWPTVWREVLAKLEVVDQPAQEPHGSDGSALHAAQTLVLGGDRTSILQDSTFRYVHTRSESAAVEFVTAALAEAPDLLSTTVICCEDDGLALRLDACLNRAGLPTAGASAWLRAHPVLQVLPLSLALCWDPVDPQALLDFLTLPLLPLPGRATSRLTRALTEEPGLGSSEWDKAVEELCGGDHDPDGELRERLDAWLLCDRTSRGGEIASDLVRERCGMVARWAAGRARWHEQDVDSDPMLGEAMWIAARQASLLGELAESQGVALTEPQLARLLEETLANGVRTTPHLEAAGGPIRVRSLSEIDAPCDRLIWLGLGTADAAGCRWSTTQLRELREAEIDVDDGSKRLSALRSAEARGYGFVTGAFIAVLLPQDLETRWHPIWLVIRGLLPKPESEPPPVLEDLVAEGDGNSLTPFVFECRKAEIEPPQKPRPLWNIPSDLLCDRETVSATDLQDRLGCPLKWTLRYQARISPSSIAELPGDFLLKGSFCHSVLDRVFGQGGDLPPVEDAVASIVRTFDERLPLDAAPLAQPDKYLECQRLRGDLENATRVLVDTLASGGYRIVGLEVELSGEAFGRPLKGWIDCVAERDDGTEAIIDFKYGGRSKYHSMIADGKAVQLATYAYGRRTANGAFPAVAYLVLADGLLYTPAGSPVHGAEGGSRIKNAPAIQTVWQQFSDAIDKAHDWLTSEAPVPARPLQDPSEWPEGATIVLEPKLPAGKVQEVCRYCDYKKICGLQATS